MDGHDSEDPKQSTAKMTVFDLLQQMQSNFRTFLDSIVSKIDEIRNRVDELEKSIYWQRFQNEGSERGECLLNASLSSEAADAVEDDRQSCANSPKSMCPSLLVSTSSITRRRSSDVQADPVDFSTSPSSDGEIFPSPFASNWLKTTSSSSVSLFTVVVGFGAVVSAFGVAIFGNFFEGRKESEFPLDE
uniref:Uncharacterized protein n=1 Tax=Salix viminalis TaxID=40686 RepID=A0A6N2KCM0_SALVM